MKLAIKTIITALFVAVLLPNNAMAINSVNPQIQKKIEQKKTIAKKGRETVVFSTNMHCESCVKKLTENLSYLKGIKDLNISLEKQEITVTFDPKKTQAAAFEKEIKKLGYKADYVKK